MTGHIEHLNALNIKCSNWACKKRNGYTWATNIRFEDEMDREARKTTQQMAWASVAWVVLEGHGLKQ